MTGYPGECRGKHIPIYARPAMLNMALHAFAFYNIEEAALILGN